MSLKSALCIGLNYPGSGNDLSGCVNDANDWADVLRGRGFNADVVLEPDGDYMRTRIRELVAKAQRGDTAVLTYSGHGSYVADTSGDEPDGHDEVLCPADCFSGNVITDDELATIFQDRERGVRLVFISDSCHSGTVARFAPAGAVDPHAPKVRFLPPSRLSLRKEYQPIQRTTPPVSRSPLKSSALLLSGCMDWEYSYDAWFGSRANGAMTRAAIDTLLRMPEGSTYRKWFTAIREKLPTAQYPQQPNLYGTSDQKRWRLP